MTNEIEAIKTVIAYVYCNNATFPCSECPYGRGGGCSDPCNSLEEAIRLLCNRYNI